MSPALSLYLAISLLAGPLAGPVLRRRLELGKEDADRLGERLGRAGRARPEGRLAWLHAASLGEANSALPLVAALRARGLQVLVTTGTVTSARRMAAVLPEGTVHQFVPVDTASAVRRFLEHWRPDLAVWIESELWPRLVVETTRRGIPMALVNARLSARSARRWGRLPGMARALLGGFRLVLAQDHETVARLRMLGVQARFAGNLKALVTVPDCDAVELDAIRAALAGRPVWLAASTHDGEERAVLAAHRTLIAGAGEGNVTPSSDSATTDGEETAATEILPSEERDAVIDGRGEATGGSEVDAMLGVDCVRGSGEPNPSRRRSDGARRGEAAEGAARRVGGVGDAAGGVTRRAVGVVDAAERAMHSAKGAGEAALGAGRQDGLSASRASPLPATGAGKRVHSRLTPVGASGGGEDASAAPLLILAPRHPERGDAVAALIAGAGLRCARRSAGRVPGAGHDATDVWLADTLGEMGLWYRLAPVAFVGGSLVLVGGHTPFEPVQLGSVVLHGPHVANFAPAYAALDGGGGSLAVTDPATLADAVRGLLADPAQAEALRERARAIHDGLKPDLDSVTDGLVALMEAA